MKANEKSLLLPWLYKSHAVNREILLLLQVRMAIEYSVCGSLSDALVMKT